MAENTQVGPSGANKAALSAANHNTGARDGRVGDNSGSGDDASSATLNKVGTLNPVNP